MKENNPSRSAKLRYAVRSKDNFIYPVDLEKNFLTILNWREQLFNKALIFSLSVFLILMIFTSVVKNNTRNIEKNIEKLNTEILMLNKELFNAEIDFIYLSSPDKLEKKLSTFNQKRYSTLIIQEFFYQQKNL